MKLIHSNARLFRTHIEGSLVIGIFAGDLRPQLDASGWNRHLPAIEAQASAEQFKGDSGSTLTFFTRATRGPAFVILVGLGERKSLKSTTLCSALESAIKTAKSVKSKKVTVAPLSLEGTSVSHSEYGHGVAEAAMLSQYSYHLKTELGGHKEGHKVEELELLHPHDDVRDALSEGDIIAQAIAFARRLSDMPPNLLHPTAFVKETSTVSLNSGGKIEITVLEKSDLTEMGAGGILAVGRGSAHPCFMVELSYTPRSGATDKVLGLIGKSVCYDSGGLCLKPGGGQEDMKRDMSGGANVLAALQAIAALDVPLSVKAYFAPVFNMTGDDAYMVGEVIDMLGGKTVEDKNTDAEGRLTLADMVEWAQRRGCHWMVQTATLTGAALHVVGDSAACLMGNNDDFTRLVLDGGKVTGEDMQWLTMFEKIRKYNKQTKIADLQNTPGSKMGGTIAAGWFCREFVRDDRPWVHLDIAPVMDSGFGVKTFVWLAQTLAKQVNG